MKITVTSKTNSNQRFFERLAEARRILNKYDREQIEYVEECQNEIAKEISRHYTEEEQLDNDDVIGVSLSLIKTDYLIGAIEDDLMTEEEFDEIFDALDIISIDTASAYA